MYCVCVLFLFFKFNKEDGKVVEEFKMRVIYIPANPPSPVPEEPEEDSSPRASVLENGHQNRSLFDAVSFSFLLSRNLFQFFFSLYLFPKNLTFDRH